MKAVVRENSEVPLLDIAVKINTVRFCRILRRIQPVLFRWKITICICRYSVGNPDRDTVFQEDPYFYRTKGRNDFMVETNCKDLFSLFGNRKVGNGAGDRLLLLIQLDSRKIIEISMDRKRAQSNINCYQDQRELRHAERYNQ